MTKPALSSDSPLLAKLKANKAAHDGEGTVQLTGCDVAATFPKFLNHGRWMKAQRLAGGDLPRAQALLLADICRFDGEKMTVEDLEQLVPAQDIMMLLGEVLSGGDDVSDDDVGEDDVGNEKPNSAAH